MKEAFVANTPDFIEPVEGKVVLLPLSKLDFDDTTFMFRAALRIGDLKRSIAEQGQQLPIIVRRRKRYDRTRQIVSGFRRANAIKDIGWDTIAAIERDDLMDDDETAFRVAVLENTARKTYSDIDRANVIRSYEDRGYSAVQVADLMGLTERQKRNLRGLLDLPDAVQQSIDGEHIYFKTTHALQLKKLLAKHGKCTQDPWNEKGDAQREEELEEWMSWVSTVNEEELSVSQLVRRINGVYRLPDRPPFDTVFNPRGTDLENRVVRLMPLKFELDDMSKQEKTALKAELLQLASML